MNKLLSMITQVHWMGILVLLSSSLANSADSWPEFRGPTGDGHASAHSHLPKHWSEDHNVTWKLALPGRGWSTPVVVEKQLWMTSASEEGHELFALVVDQQDGKLINRIPLFTIDSPAPRNPLNSYASPSPVTDGKRVYVHFGTYGIAAIDATSKKVIWSRNDVPLDHQEGPGSSLILFQNRLIVHYDGRDQQFIISLNCDTGQTLWRSERSIDLSKVGDFSRKAFTTPLLIGRKKTDGESQARIISSAAQGCYCYDPSNGQEIWQVQYPGFSAVPRPVASATLTYVVDGFANPKIYAIRLGGGGRCD